MPAQRPRASRLQFSLRAVLIVLTLVAIGGWWWQKQFQVESTIQRRRAGDSGIQVVELEKSESRRRQGLGDAVLDGPTTIVNPEGILILEEQWRQGIRHGIYRRWNDAGDLLFECEFKRGRLICVADTPVVDFIPSDDLNGRPHRRQLHRDCVFDYFDMPLKDVIEDIGFNSNLPIVFDARRIGEAGIDIQTPITRSFQNVPVFIALIELLAPLDLACAYQYELFWVTTPGSVLYDGKLAPQVITDHASDELLNKLTRPVASFDYYLQPLGSVLEDQGFINGIPIESDLRDEAEPVTLYLRDIPLRSALGALSHIYELRIEAIGDKLVITEVEGRKPRPNVSRDDLPKSDPAADSFSDPFADPISKGPPVEDPFSGR